MANIEKLEKTHFVLKIEDINKYLSKSQMWSLRDITKTIDEKRVEDGKHPTSENVHVVINVDEPYIDEIIDTLAVNGHWGFGEEAQ
ncbi:hypothetical protein [Paenibacillus odorifer]|uniref:hypothetical protein n=1 Tax=Paenibacillus odorifer TaxID=189426 RepID=UPI0009D696E2|nr:hypothetical protein [Paenibacillus odorifer]